MKRKQNKEDEGDQNSRMQGTMAYKIRKEALVERERRQILVESDESQYYQNLLPNHVYTTFG